MSLRPRSEYSFPEEGGAVGASGHLERPVKTASVYTTYTVKFYRDGAKGDEIPEDARVAEIVENMYVKDKLELSFVVRRWGNRYFYDNNIHENGKSKTDISYKLPNSQLEKDERKIFMAKTKREIEALIEKERVWGDDPDWNGKYSLEWF